MNLRTFIYAIACALIVCLVVLLFVYQYTATYQRYQSISSQQCVKLIDPSGQVLACEQLPTNASYTVVWVP